MEKMIHLAAQYLATAGIKFFGKKANDSHYPNLGSMANTGYLETWPLNENGCLNLHWIICNFPYIVANDTTRLDYIPSMENRMLNIVQWVDSSQLTALGRTEHLFYKLPLLTAL